MELKDPTTNQGLVNISDKDMRYQQQFRSVVMELFDVQDEER